MYAEDQGHSISAICKVSGMGHFPFGARRVRDRAWIAVKADMHSLLHGVPITGVYRLPHNLRFSRKCVGLRSHESKMFFLENKCGRLSGRNRTQTSTLEFRHGWVIAYGRCCGDPHQQNRWHPGRYCARLFEC